jgi:phosphotransferase system enzyme I (PtsP)
MLEVPSLAWQLDGLCKIADFISVGSNDLQQFFFASDRGNTRLAGRYDPLHPALLRFLHHIAEAGRRHGIPVGVCGEMAGRPLEAMALIGVGFRSISMQPAGIGPVKMMLRSLSVQRLETAMGQMLQSDPKTIRAALQEFATKEGVSI